MKNTNYVIRNGMKNMYMYTYVTLPNLGHGWVDIKNTRLFTEEIRAPLHNTMVTLKNNGISANYGNYQLW